MIEGTNVDPRLPHVEGGWEIQQGRYAQLWAPKQPDALFDPDADVERSEYHASMPYWAWVWDAVEPCVAGLIERSADGRVLELGAGLGAVGIALAKELGSPVTLSDGDPVAVAAMEVNVELNGLQGTRVWHLDWRELSGAPPERFDLIVGCEVIYDPRAHGPLLETVRRFLEPESGRALIFDPGRAPARQFARRAERLGFSVGVEDPDGGTAPIVPGEARWLSLQISPGF